MQAYIRKIIPALLVMGLVPALASAQSFSTVYFSGGYSQVDVEPLASLLNQSEPVFYGVPPEDYYSFGFGMRIGSTKWRVGWDVQYLGRDTDEVRGTGIAVETRLSATQIVFDVNYGLIRAGHNRLVIAPTVGVGYEKTRLSIQIPVESNFEEVLAGPGRGTQLTRYNALLDAALQIDFALRFDPEFDEVGWILGVRAGYRYNPFGFKWREQIGDFGGRSVDDGPEFSMAGPYVRLTLGL